MRCRFQYAECTVEPEKPDSEIFEMPGYKGIDFLRVHCLVQFFGKRADFFGNKTVEKLFTLGNGVVIAEKGKTADAQILFQRCKIEMHKTAEDFKIMQCNAFDGAMGSACALAGEGKGILMGDHEKREIILPQVAVKTIGCGQIQNPFHLLIDAMGKLGLAHASEGPVAVDAANGSQDFVPGHG